MSDVNREQIYDFFKSHPEKPWHLQDIQRQLNVSDRTWLKRELAELVDEGQLVRTRKNSYGLPQEMNLILGRLQVTAGGYGFVIPEADGEGEKEKDLFVPADALGGAWDGDKVMARPNPLKSNDGRISGEIVRILERKHSQLVGTLEYSRGYAILRPDSPRLRERILLSPESVGKTEAGSRIVASIVWPETSGEKDPFATLEEVLGEGDDPEVETRAVIVKYGLKDEFDEKTVAEAAAIPPQVMPDMMEGRNDLRELNVFTIDGADAKDFDDAISLERVKGGKGSFRIGIHIADVSYYVAEGTSLDAEAKERATSVYLPGQVLPMLPESVSNGICSLVEGEDRLALSVFVDITKEGEVKGMKVKETIIRSSARLTYEQVQEFADGGRLPQGKRKLERDIKQLLNLTQLLRDSRFGAGALDFEFTEAKVDVDDKGALHVMPIKSNQARQLIEELMLLANRLVAQELSQRDIPALYRVHEDPSDSKIETLQKALGRLGYELDLEHSGPAELQSILKAAAGKPEAQLVSTLLLRSLKQARYSAENLGHFGLAFENYLHFTSPIRRYPDLVVHRVLKVMLQHRLSPTLKERMRTDFPLLAEHTSERERVAEEAERDLTRYYHARWAKEHQGEQFNGFITGVTNFGVFVALPNGVEGLIHISQLDDDYYMFMEDQMMLMGKSSKRKFRLGSRVDVKILSANATIRQIELLPGYMEMPTEAELAERAERSERPERPERQQGRRGAPPKNLRTPAGANREARAAERDAGALNRNPARPGPVAAAPRREPASPEAPGVTPVPAAAPAALANMQANPQASSKPNPQGNSGRGTRADTSRPTPTEATPAAAPEAAPAEASGKRKRRVLVFGGYHKR